MASGQAPGRSRLLWWAGMFPDDLRSFPGAVTSTMSPMEQLGTFTVANGECARGSPQLSPHPSSHRGFGVSQKYKIKYVEIITNHSISASHIYMQKINSSWLLYVCWL